MTWETTVQPLKHTKSVKCWTILWQCVVIFVIESNCSKEFFLFQIHASIKNGKLEYTVTDWPCNLFIEQVSYFCKNPEAVDSILGINNVGVIKIRVLQILPNHYKYWYLYNVQVHSVYSNVQDFIAQISEKTKVLGEFL